MAIIVKKYPLFKEINKNGSIFVFSNTIPLKLYQSPFVNFQIKKFNQAQNKHLSLLAIRTSLIQICAFFKKCMKMLYINWCVRTSKIRSVAIRTIFNLQ